MSVPTPVPPVTVPLVTIALDRQFDLRRSRPEGAIGLPGIPGYVRLPGEPTIHLFAFGAAVVEAEAIDPAIVARLAEATGAGVLPDTEETWSVRGGGDEPSVGWDRIGLPRIDERRVATVALLLAESAALERYDRQANSLLDEVLAILGALGSRRRLPWARAELIGRIAGITAAQLELSRSFFLVDRPDVTWEDPVAARVFDAVYEHLELEERHAAVQQKLGNLSSALRTVADLQHGHQGIVLETTIVVLIVVEVVLALILGH